MIEETRSPGKTTISPEVLLTIIRLTTLEVEGVYSMSPVSSGVNRFLRRNISQGVQINIEDGIVDVDLYVILEKNANVRDVSLKIQETVLRTITEMIGMQAGIVNIHVEDIHYEDVSEEN